MVKQRTNLRKCVRLLAVAGTLGVCGTALAVVPAIGQFSTLTRAPQLSRGDVVQNMVPLSRSIRVTVALKLRNDTQLKAALEAARANGQSRHPLMDRTQLVATHLPTATQAQAVAAYLKKTGFTRIEIHPGNMLVSGYASAAVVQEAFQTSLVDVRTHDGRNAFANSAPIKIPTALKDTVQAVLGLQTVHKAHILARSMAAGSVGVQGHYPQEFSSIYDASGLPAATDVAAAVWGWGSMQNSVNDLDDFMANTGLTVGSVNVVCTDTNGVDYYTGAALGGYSIGDPTCGGLDDAGEIEWSMDSQTILAMSGGLKSLTFYAAYDGDNTALTDTLNEIINPTLGEPQPQVINASFGECERYEDANQGGDGSMQTDDALFQVAAAQGLTFSVSTGDSGAAECSDGQADSASYPASSPWVVAVSGTTLRASATSWSRENVWAGSGGSPSSAEQAPSWQAGLTYGQYAGMRGPDVAFDASPFSGEMVLIQGDYEQVGGTSLAAPLFSGAWARILQGDPSLGFAAPHLYALSASALHDVTAGNNGQYVAKPGWDWVTGRGSFDVGKAADALQ